MNVFDVNRLTEIKRALFIQPHPDDNEIGAGATVAWLADRGCDVHYLTVTDGRAGSDDPHAAPEQIAAMRRQEHEAAGRILGVSHFHWLGFPDGRLRDTEQLREAMTRVIRTVRPEILFTVDPWLPYEGHLDHIVTGQVAAFCALTSGNPHFFPEHRHQGLAPHAVHAVAFYTTRAPNAFIAADPYWEKKLAAIGAHKSQFSGEYFAFVKEYLTAKAREYAKKADTPWKLAEAFKVLTPVMLHMNVDAAEM